MREVLRLSAKELISNWSLGIVLMLANQICGSGFPD